MNIKNFPIGTIFFTFVIGFVLNLMVYPEWMKYAKPDWVLLILFYWCLAIPERIAVGTGWVMGIIMDVLNYTILGQHAIGKAFVAFIAVAAHRRIRLYEIWQQCIIVFIIASIDVGFTLWVSSLVSGTEVKLIYWQSSLMTALIWPLVYISLRVLRHKKGIHL